jgi:hypothetical protein
LESVSWFRVGVATLALAACSSDDGVATGGGTSMDEGGATEDAGTATDSAADGPADTSDGGSGGGSEGSDDADPCTPLASHEVLDAPSGIRTATRIEDDALVATGGLLVRVAADGTTTDLVSDVGVGVADLGVGSDRIVWKTFASGPDDAVVTTIWQAPIAGGASEPVLDGLPRARRLVALGADLWWATDPTATDPTLYRLIGDAAMPEVVDDLAEGFLTQLDVFDTSVLLVQTSVAPPQDEGWMLAWDADGAPRALPEIDDGGEPFAHIAAAALTSERLVVSDATRPRLLEVPAGGGATRVVFEAEIGGPGLCGVAGDVRNLTTDGTNVFWSQAGEFVFRDDGDAAELVHDSESPWAVAAVVATPDQVFVVEHVASDGDVIPSHVIALDAE